MGKYRYLIKNIGLLAMANFATRLLSFLMVPLYTNIVSTGEYGIYDLFVTTINLLVPILTLNITDAVCRFSLDKEYDRNAIVVVGTKYVFIANFVVAVGLVINSIFNIAPSINEYSLLFFLMFVVNSISGVIIGYTRGIERVADLSISSIIASAVTIGLNIFFLVVLKWGITGYFIANIIGPFIQCVYLFFRDKLYNGFQHIKLYKNEQKEMLSYCKPLMANTISWWINNASDRYIVIFFCGISENGIYSVASKIPSLLNIFQSIFGQAWTISVVKDFDPEDKDEFYSLTYRLYNCLMTVMCSFIIWLDKILARILYTNDFYSAWKYVPWLTIAVVFSSLTGYLGGFFSAVKDSKTFSFSTTIGAISNILLNFLLTPIMGAMGAAIATTVCYAIVWVYRYVYAMSIIKMKIEIKRDILSYFILCVQAILLLIIIDNVYLYFAQFMLLAVIFILYRKDLLFLINKCMSALNRTTK